MVRKCLTPVQGRGARQTCSYPIGIAEICPAIARAALVFRQRHYVSGRLGHAVDVMVAAWPFTVLVWWEACQCLSVVVEVLWRGSLRSRRTSAGISFMAT